MCQNVLNDSSASSRKNKLLLTRKVQITGKQLCWCHRVFKSNKSREGEKCIKTWRVWDERGWNRTTSAWPGGNVRVLLGIQAAGLGMARTALTPKADGLRGTSQLLLERKALGARRALAASPLSYTLVSKMRELSRDVNTEQRGSQRWTAWQRCTVTLSQIRRSERSSKESADPSRCALLLLSCSWPRSLTKFHCCCWPAVALWRPALKRHCCRTHWTCNGGSMCGNLYTLGIVTWTNGYRCFLPSIKSQITTKEKVVKISI